MGSSPAGIHSEVLSQNQNKKNRETNAGILQILITMMTSLGYQQNIADEIKSNK